MPGVFILLTRIVEVDAGDPDLIRHAFEVMVKFVEADDESALLPRLCQCFELDPTNLKATMMVARDTLSGLLARQASKAAQAACGTLQEIIARAPHITNTYSREMFLDLLDEWEQLVVRLPPWPADVDVVNTFAWWAVDETT